jgi:hypothetical protein
MLLFLVADQVPDYFDFLYFFSFQTFAFLMTRSATTGERGDVVAGEFQNGTKKVKI